MERPSSSQFSRARLALASRSRSFTPKNPTPKEQAIIALGKQIRPSQVGLSRRRKTRRGKGKKSRRMTRKH